MSTPVLPPRYTPDSIAMSRAAARLGRQVERLASWRVPEGFGGTGGAGVTIYGEPLFVTVVAGPLDVEVLEPAAAAEPEGETVLRVRDGLARPGEGGLP